MFHPEQDLGVGDGAPGGAAPPSPAWCRPAGSLGCSPIPIGAGVGRWINCSTQEERAGGGIDGLPVSARPEPVLPCAGTKGFTRRYLHYTLRRNLGHIASLFLGQQVRPVVLLDGDDAGRARRDALMKELYADYERAVLMLGDVLEKEKCETEDIIGEATILPVLKEVLWKQSEN